jgi:hypothetical protein
MQFVRSWIPVAGVMLAATACDSATPTAAPAPPRADVSASAAPAFSGVRESSTLQLGRALAPVELNMTGKNPALVALGSYLVHTHACNDCHTNPPFAEGGDPFMGQPMVINADAYLAGGAPFGPFTSRNITPRANGRPAGMSLEEFVLVMRTGIDLDNKHPEFGPLLQVMPWPFFKDLSDHDLRAIYEYLSAIPCVARADQSPTRCG